MTSDLDRSFREASASDHHVNMYAYVQASLLKMEKRSDDRPEYILILLD
jgi:hypothetical protein